MKMIIATLFFVLFALVQNVDAQEKTLPEFKHSVGFDAGASNGYGLSYKYMPSKWGIQFNGFPVATPNEYHISIGVTALRSLYENQKIRFFTYLGNHLIFEKTDSYYDYYSSPNNTYTKSTEWVIGAGPGFEFYIAKRIALNFRFGVGYYHYGEEDWEIMPDGGFGIHFRF